ncbi:D,D-heptose 1,7-bisphosphate phosphatase [Trinickia caryophylli]|uniref:D,D-heptose 1,7-bisphosphate phosphatase n=1 Tax=Trinickia caryophylli TaxID=28094 RepID=A0A1X7CPK7_TRICW|nr:HAD family hydrolase [Trinickia caryophylli]TRX20129.1 HAD family hydrolase [Trinickia caryophylli]GLU30204.1 D,D-heptose 1,7-bisphosphate phosphatase [Trinickia caryophylli]SMF00070.1 D-alpha,beta-D-heptose 1,7-bisphosphate phosphatase [Trinickia caryophylli]
MARPALFLDRDGVINVDKHYVHRREDFEFVEGIFDLCAHAMTAGMALVVVTNQAGIGRGYYTEREFHDLTEWMRGRFTAHGVTLDAVYFCPFHPEHGLGRYKTESCDRKPNPGMIVRACSDLRLDPARSALVGDKPSDIAAGRAAGVGKTILLNDRGEPCTPEPDLVVRSLAQLDAWLFGGSFASTGT